MEEMGAGENYQEQGDVQQTQQESQQVSQPANEASSPAPAGMKRKIPRILEQEEVARMFQAARINNRDFMILKCVYYLGLTNKEVRTILCRDINLEKGKARIVNKGKGRWVPVPQDFSRELSELIANRGGNVFWGRSENKTISDRHIRRIVKKYAQLADVRNYEEIHPHTLRHSYAAHLKMSGVSMADLQKMLGLARKETANIYGYIDVMKSISGKD